MPRKSRPPTTNRQPRKSLALLNQLVSSKQLAYELNVHEMTVRRWLRQRYAKHDRTFWLFTPEEAEEVRRYLKGVVNGGRGVASEAGR